MKKELELKIKRKDHSIELIEEELEKSNELLYSKEKNLNDANILYEQSLINNNKQTSDDKIQIIMLKEEIE